jgi:hypothetical protein
MEHEILNDWKKLRFDDRVDVWRDGSAVQENMRVEYVPDDGESFFAYVADSYQKLWFQKSEGFSLRPSHQ